MSKYIYWVKKKTCLGVFRIEEIREKDNETGLKDGGFIEMSIYSAFHIRDARSPSLKILTIIETTIICGGMTIEGRSFTCSILAVGT